MEEYHLDLTLQKLIGPSTEQIAVNNQWAAMALDKFHSESKAKIIFDIEGIRLESKLTWNSNFPKAAMREEIDMANHGGVALAWFVMSVIKDYCYVEQSEIGEGVDYRFKKEEPSDDELNFLDEYQFVEVSGILEESRTNTLERRIKEKHNQIRKGLRKEEPSSVIVTLFSKPITVKENHK